MHIIYGLQDPRDRLFFYVGMTDDVFKRFAAHIQCSGSNYEKNAKITEMRSQNIMPYMVELQRTEDTGLARIREAYWIQHYISLGHPITNIVHSDIKFTGKVLVRSKSIRSPKEAIKTAERALSMQQLPERTLTEAPLESAVKAAEKIVESVPQFSEEDERQILEAARVQMATYGRVIRSKIPASMAPPRNNAIYPVVKYICDREGL
jgi:predicted GIY-YIG superfamily endonuclease